MRETILERAQSYGLHYDEAVLRSDEIRAKSPMLFIMLGHKVKDGINIMQEALNESIINAEGAVYFYLDLEGEKVGVPSFTFPFKDKEALDFRGSMRTKLIEDTGLLMELGKKVYEVRKNILSKNKMFNEWEQIHVEIVTSSDDPINVLLPDIAVLMKRKLEEDFKQIFMDLFVIVQEEGENTAFSQALTMSLFKELDSYQSPQFEYKRPLEVVDENIKIDLTYHQSLFDIAYIFTDKQENGQKLSQPKENHYRTIVATSLLKNRYQKNMSLEEAGEQYNNAIFINSIRSQDKPTYASATLAEVKKPYVGIYTAVGYYLYKEYEKSLKVVSKMSVEELMRSAYLSEDKLSLLANEILPSKQILENMYSLMSYNKSFKELKNVSFKEAETLLYGKACETFFKNNLVNIGGQFFKNDAAKSWGQFSKNDVIDDRGQVSKSDVESIRGMLVSEVLNDSRYGPYMIGEFFKEESRVRREGLKEKLNEKIRSLEDDVQKMEGQRVGERIGSKFTLFDKKNLGEVKDYLFKEIYGKQYEILQEKVKLQALQYIEGVLEEIYEEVRGQLEVLKEIEEELRELMDKANRFEDEYLVQNVSEYYEKVVHKKVEELTRSRGENFLQDEKFMGSLSELIIHGKEEVLNRIFDLCEKYILPDVLQSSFEEELLARANMAVTYEDKAIVAKRKLYDLLYDSLENNSRVCVYLDTVQMSHRYEEKYFFGDRTSEFMNYVYQRDQVSRNYKLGYLNDKKQSSMQKLQLMGGFRLEDLIFTKVANRYYEAYQSQGYVFHDTELKI